MPVQREKQNVIALYQNFRVDIYLRGRLFYDKVELLTCRKQFSLYKIDFNFM